MPGVTRLFRGRLASLQVVIRNQDVVVQVRAVGVGRHHDRAPGRQGLAQARPDRVRLRHVRGVAGVEFVGSPRLDDV